MTLVLALLRLIKLLIQPVINSAAFISIALIYSHSIVLGQVNFEDLSFTEAIAKANEQKKYVFLDFRADWCKPCIEMERTTFQDTNVGNYLSEKAISLKVDVDQFSGMDIKEMYNVNQYPTMLILDPYDSSVQLRMIGFKPANILLGDLKFVMDEIVSDQPDDTTPVPEPDSKPVKKKCFLTRWLDKITE